MVTVRNVSNINAETVISRCRDLRILFDVLSGQKDPYEWSLPDQNVRPTLNWSGKWTVTDDARLLVGAYLHGFGNWEGMVKDARLNLDGKFFLEEGKKSEGDAASRPIPNAIHLVRRGDYLLGHLREHEEKIRNFVQTNKHNGGVVRAPSTSILKRSASPAASTSYALSMKRRAESEAVASIDDGSNKKRKRRPTPTFTDSSSSEECPSMDEASTKEELRPVKKHLVRPRSFLRPIDISFSCRKH